MKFDKIAEEWYNKKFGVFLSKTRRNHKKDLSILFHSFYEFEVRDSLIYPLGKLILICQLCQDWCYFLCSNSEVFTNFLYSQFSVSVREVIENFIAEFKIFFLCLSKLSRTALILFVEKFNLMLYKLCEFRIRSNAIKPEKHFEVISLSHLSSSHSFNHPSHFVRLSFFTLILYSICDFCQPFWDIFLFFLGHLFQAPPPLFTIIILYWLYMSSIFGKNNDYLKS